MPAARGKFAAEVDEEVVAARLLEERDHAVERMALGDAAEVERQAACSLRDLRRPSMRQAAPAMARACAVDRPEPTARDQRADGRVERPPLALGNGERRAGDVARSRPVTAHVAVPRRC